MFVNRDGMNNITSKVEQLICFMSVAFFLIFFTRPFINCVVIIDFI